MHAQANQNLAKGKPKGIRFYTLCGEIAVYVCYMTTAYMQDYWTYYFLVRIIWSLYYLQALRFNTCIKRVRRGRSAPFMFMYCKQPGTMFHVNARVGTRGDRKHCYKYARGQSARRPRSRRLPLYFIYLSLQVSLLTFDSAKLPRTDWTVWAAKYSTLKTLPILKPQSVPSCAASKEILAM